jgi:hypothetical protein
MHDPKGIFFDDLEPNATYQVRHWLYVTADLTSHEWDGRVGTLVIVQGRSAKPGTKRDRGVYAVQEVLNPGAGGRQFLVAKQDDPTDPPAEVPPAVPEDGAKHEIYEVYLGDGLLPARPFDPREVKFKPQMVKNNRAWPWRTSTPGSSRTGSTRCSASRTGRTSTRSSPTGR